MLGASGLRWKTSRSGLYSEFRLPKIDNARPFGDLELAQKCRHDSKYDMQNMCLVERDDGYLSVKRR
jgi:hypothetical protein